MGRLENKIAIITGGSSGIGREAALLMAGEGATVIAVGRRQGPLDEVVNEIEAAGGKCVSRSVDLLDGDAAAELGAWAEAKFGRVDILVNNAGYSSTVRSIRYVQPEEWDEVFTINVGAVYRLTQSLLQGMTERGEGTIITVSSMAALNPGPLGGAPYSAAKAAALTIMKYINSELRNTGVRASTIIPAEVNTPLLDKRAVRPPMEDRDTMMGPRDVAEAILLCATLPQRTVIEQIVMTPSHIRDQSHDVAALARVGAP